MKENISLEYSLYIFKLRKNLDFSLPQEYKQQTQSIAQDSSILIAEILILLQNLHSPILPLIHVKPLNAIDIKNKK